MKKPLFVLFWCFLSGTLLSQTFWTENFGTGCTQANQANGTATTNGNWVVTPIGAQDPDANVWFISATEAGMGATVCGDGCLNNAALTNRTLHVGSLANLFCPSGDCGAAYDAGGVITSTTTNKRVESPTINCTGFSNITLAFNYMEEGDPPADDASVYYFDGVTWSLLTNTPATNNGSCTPQGTWTAFSIALPASANNNANVKIGFLWVNNNDGAGTDPSFAVDDITLTATPTSGPTVSITPPASATVCPGIPVTLNGNCVSGCPLNSWSWSVNPTTGVTPSTGSTQNFNVTFSTAGTYTVSLVGTNGSGPSPVVTQTIVVSPSPTVSVNPSSATICSGGTGASLTASGATTYTWSPATGLSATTGATVNANPTTTTTYTVVGLNGTCPGMPVPVVVTVSPALNPTITGSAAAICSAQTLTLTATGGSAYTWASSQAPNPPSSATVTPTPTNTGSTPIQVTYTLTASGSGCPSATATFTVTVNPAPNVSVSPSSVTVCGTTGATLTASSTTPGTNFTWSPALGLSSTTGATVTATPATSTTYTVTGTFSGCQDTASVFVQFNNSVTVTAVPTSYIVCQGSSVTLSGTPSTGSYTYSWLGPGNVSVGTTASINITPTTSGIYTLTVNGPCATAPSNTDTVSLTVQACTVPQAGFSSTYPEICGGGCIAFTDTSTGIPSAWQWTFPGGNPSSSTLQNPGVCYPYAGYYDVTLVVTNSLGTNTVTLTNYVHVNVSPVADGGPNQSINNGENVTLNGGGGVSYIWSPSTGLSCSNCQSPVASPSVTTEYILTVYNSAGCYDYDTVLVEVKQVCEDIFIANAFSPNDDGNNDVLHVLSTCLKKMTFRIYDRWGNKVFETKDRTQGWDGKFNGQPMDSGVYAWWLEGNDETGKYFKVKGNVSIIR